ncbi:MAG: hydrogenase iron-sulfur subunit, partial [Chloroflexi bacterium]|nr:hydrogenase iron-sulfur subunit [Chloroflexota bacterium]
IEPGRIKLVWASAAEGVKLAEEISKMVEEVRALGPLNWNGHDQTFEVFETSKVSELEAA